MGMLRGVYCGFLCLSLLAGGLYAQSAVENYARLPLAFERQGERFVARGPGYAVGLDSGKVSIGVVASDETTRAVSLEFAGAPFSGARRSRAVTGPELPGKINYYLGNDPRKWQVGLPTYDRVTYREVYPGIDVIYYGNQQQLEFDLVVKPGADPEAIRLKVGGAGRLSIDGSGALSLGEAAGGLRIALPRIYQEVNGTKKNVPGRYAIVGPDEVAFKIDPWDHASPLVIDPTIVYSAIFGGGISYSESFGVAVDSSGNIIVSGVTTAADFPILNAAQNSLKGTGDGFVTKINPAGTALIYSTYLGGSSNQYGFKVAVDSTNSAWVTGATDSSDFPVRNAAQPTITGTYAAFVARLDSAGALQFSTYLGGTGYASGNGIAVDSLNNGYVTGQTYNGTFPTTAGAVQTASGETFVTKYAPAGTVVYSTLLGGSGTSGEAIAVDSLGDAYVVGTSYDSTFPGMPSGGAQTTNNGNGDAFVAKLNPAATTLLYFTFLGGTGADSGVAIAVDASFNAYVAGGTSSSGLATAGAAQAALAGGTNGFAAKLNPSGSAFSYVTYLGGNRADQLQGLALDGGGNVYLTGYTDSNTFPTVLPVQAAFPGNGVSLFNSTNSGGTWTAFDTNITGAVVGVSINPAGTSAVALTDAGIYRTVNGGASWTQESSIQFNYYTSESSVSRSPVAPGTIYAASCCDSVYQSTDDGLTWTYMGFSSIGCCAASILADPLTANTVYLYGGGSSPYVSVSVDGGATWNPAATGLPAQVYSLVAATDGALYAGTYGYGIYKSANQGGSWTAINTGLPSNAYAYYAQSLSASGTTVYFASATIYVTTNGGASWAPTPTSVDASLVAASAQNASTLYAMTYSQTVQESTDGGTTWNSAGIGLPSSIYNQNPGLVVDPSNGAHVLVISEVSPAGFVAKLNNAGSALTWSTYLGGTSATQPYGVATDGLGDAFVAGYTCCSGFPITSTALPAGYGVFITKISDATAECIPGVSPASALASQYGGTLTFDVLDPSGCAWSAATSAPWAVITSGASGTGTGIVTVQIAANSSGATQAATLTVGSQNVIITQPSSSCTWSMDKTSYPVPVGGGTVSAILTASAGCPWAVTDNYPAAITITANASGTGSATIGLTVAPNLSGSALNFNLSAGNTSIQIAEAGGVSAQTIAFDAIPNQIFGISPFVIAAQASSLLPVGFVSTTPTICTLADDLVMLLKAGTCSITASQAGNANYSAATSVTRSFTVSVAKQSGSFTAASGSPLTVAGSATSVAVGDFNGDGIPDLATASGDSVTVMLGGGTGGFNPAPGSPFAVGSDPNSVVVGDFNGDGIQDLAVANYFDNNVTVLLGNGSGGFTPAPGSPFAVGTNPYCVVVGDFNGDGIQDLATANWAGSSLSVLLGNGSGGFTAATGSPFAAGINPRFVVVGDFNRDGIEDLAAVNRNGNNLTVLLGNGSGGFTAATGSPFAVGTSPTSLAVGDFNGDGNPDLAIGNEGSNNVTVFLGNGLGGFTSPVGSPFAVGSAPYSVVAADVNGDGIQDLIVANANSSNVTVLLGNGSGGFTPAAGSPYAAGTEPLSVAVGDFNGDGIEDLATANYAVNTVTVLLGVTAGSSTITGSVEWNGTPVPGATVELEAPGDFYSLPVLASTTTGSDGSFTISNAPVGSYMIYAVSPSSTYWQFSGYSVTLTAGGTANVGILRLSEKLQLLSPASGATGVTTTPTLQWSAFTGATSYNVEVFDNATSALVFNQSTAAAQITVTPALLPGASYQWSVYASNSNGQIAYYSEWSFTTSAVGSQPQTITFDKIPNQIFGISPFVIAAQASSLLPVGFVSTTLTVCTIADDLVMLLKAGTCSIMASQPGNATYSAAISVTQSFTVSVANPSGSFMAAAAGSPFGVGAGPHSVARGDFNGDGIADLATANFDSGNVTVLLGNGSGGFDPASISPSTMGANPIAVAVGDFNGDGNQDLAVANLGGGVTVLLGNGSGGFTVSTGSPFAAGMEPEAVAVGDFNGDGIQDLAIANSGSSNLTVLLGNGSGGFAAATGSPFAVGAHADSVAVGDFNGDGIQDLAVANGLDNSATVLLGNGSGGFATASGSPFAAGTYPLSVAVGDFNGDGIQDLAVASQSSGNVTVLLGNGSGGFAPAPGSPFAVQGNPGSVAVGDFNGDGIQDLATANQNADTLTVLLGNGSGGFSAIPDSPLAAGTLPGAIVVADFNGDGIEDLAVSNYASGNVTVLLGFVVGNTPQTITFGPLSSVTFGVAPFTLSATSSSGLPVSFASTAATPSPNCTVAGNAVTVVAVGPCSITASQPGNATYAAAATVTRSFTVNAGTQTVTFGPLSNLFLGSTPPPLSAAASSGLAVSFASTTGTICTVSGTTVTLVAVGTCTITASQAGNANYAAAVAVTESFTISADVLAYASAENGTSLTSSTFGTLDLITGSYTQIATIYYFISDLAVAPDGTVYALAQPYSNLSAGELATINPTTGAVTSVGPLTVGLESMAFDGSGTLYGITYEASGPDQLYTVNPSSGATTFVTNLSGTNATDSNQLRFIGNTAYTTNYVTPSSLFTIDLTTGAGTLIGSTGLNPDNGLGAVVGGQFVDIASVGAGGQIFMIDPATGAATPGATTNDVFVFDGVVQPLFTQTIAFGPLSNVAYGVSPFTISATANSGLAVSFVSTTSTVCTVTGNTVTIGGVGTCTIVASQTGNADYAAAATVTQSFTVGTRSQTISFGPLSNQIIGAPSFALSATATSGLTVTFASNSTAVCTVSGVTVTLLTSGTCSITASQPGNADYAAAPPVTQTFTISPIPQTITFGPLRNQALTGSTPPTLSATATSGLAVTFTSNSPSVCTVFKVYITLLSAGTCSITANQAGNATYAAATPVTQTFTVSLTGYEPVAAFLDQNGAPALTFNGSIDFPDAGGFLIGPPGVAQDLNGNVYLVGLDGAGGVHLNSYGYANSTWNGWQYSGGILDTSSGLTAAVDPSGVVWFTGRDIGNRFWINSWNGTTFGGWILVADGIFASDSVPQIAIPSDGTIYVIGKDIGGRIWSNSYNPTNQTFTGWVDRQAVMIGQPSATAGQDGMVYVAVRSVASESPVYITQIPAQNAATANTWLNGGGEIDTDPQIASQGGTVYLLAEADGATVYLLTFAESNQMFGTWNFTNGILNDSTIAAADGDVFIAGRDNLDRIYWYSLTGNNWSFADGAGVSSTVLSGGK
jgi:hypothetical protein